MKTNPKIAFIMNSFPVLSETFVLKEVIGLRQRGINVKSFSLFAPRSTAGQNDDLMQNTFYLLPNLSLGSLITSHLSFMFSRPIKYFATFLFSLRNRETHFSVFLTLLKLKTDAQNKAVRQDLFVHFILAIPLAIKIQRTGARFINAQFADAAASFAMLTSRLLKIPYGITMHAYDIFAPQYNMSQKLFNAVYIFTCTKFNKNYLMQQRPELDGKKIKVVYHGIDIDRFVPIRKKTSGIPVLLSIGRLVHKKGFKDLLQACLILKHKGLQFKCKIVGNGPLKDELAQFINENNLSETVALLGSIPHSEMIEQYKSAFVFVLPCVVEKDGNRDGIPNVIAEAMAMELPVVSTTVSGIPELVQDKKTGYLVEPHNAELVANAIEHLIINPDQANQYGKNSRIRVKEIFSSEKWLDELSHDYLDIVKENM